MGGKQVRFGWGELVGTGMGSLAQAFRAECDALKVTFPNMLVACLEKAEEEQDRLEELQLSKLTKILSASKHSLYILIDTIRSHSPTCNTLKRLDLDSIVIDTETTRLLGASISKGQAHITRLSLAGCSLSDHQGATICRNLGMVEWLSISNNKCGKETAAELEKQLSSSTSKLGYLDLSNNKFGDKIGTLFLGALHGNHTLGCLKLNHCGLSFATSTIFLQLFDSALIDLDLRHNNISPARVKQIHQRMKSGWSVEPEKKSLKTTARKQYTEQQEREPAVGKQASLISTLRSKQENCSCPELQRMLRDAADVIDSQSREIEEMGSAIQLYKNRAEKAVKSNSEIRNIITEYAHSDVNIDHAQTGVKTFMLMIGRLEEEVKCKQQQIEALQGRTPECVEPIVGNSAIETSAMEKTVSIKEKLAKLEESLVRVEIKHHQKSNALAQQKMQVQDLIKALDSSGSRLAQLENQIATQDLLADENDKKWQTVVKLKDEQIQHLENLLEQNAAGAASPECSDTDQASDFEERKDDNGLQECNNEGSKSVKSPSSPNNIKITNQGSVVPLKSHSDLYVL